MINKILKLWHNYWWRKHPPEQVKYYKTQQFEKARLIMTDEGIIFNIDGEEFIRGRFSRINKAGE